MSGDTGCFILAGICDYRSVVKGLSVVVYPSAYRIGIVRARVSTVLYADPHTNWSEVVYVRTSCDSAGIEALISVF